VLAARSHIGNAGRRWPIAYAEIRDGQHATGQGVVELSTRQLNRVTFRHRSVP
jgi:hypothetical protein